LVEGQKMQARLRDRTSSRRRVITKRSRHSGSHLAHPKYRADIDGLRGIAVLAVVGFHAFPGWVKGGFVGVDVFFVISGYLISSIILGSLAREAFSFAEFYSRRIRRIFPALIVVLIATYVMGWFVLLPEEYKQLGGHILGGAGFISNFLLWRDSGYFDSSAQAKPLLHLWSLGVEEQFYIIWPLLLYFTWKLRSNFLRLILLLALSSFVLNVSQVRDHAVATFYSPATRLWELLIGGILAYLSFHKNEPPTSAGQLRGSFHHFTTFLRTQRARDLESFLGFCLVAAAILILAKDKPFPGWWALLPTVGACFLIAAGPAAWFNRVVLQNPVLVWFGLISFPFYLWHWPLLSFAFMDSPVTGSPSMGLVAVVTSIALAWLTYRLVEKPMRFGGNGRNKTLALFAAVTLIGAVGFVTYKLDGWSHRFNTAMSEDELRAQRDRYWNHREELPFDKDFTNVVIFGDSQARDVFEALSHDSRLRLHLITTSYTCSAFFRPATDEERHREECLKLFDAMLVADQLLTADVLIYAPFWRKDFEERQNYAEGLKQIRSRNGRLRIYFFGNKPFLGSEWLSINRITKSHRSRLGMNEFLDSIKVVPETVKDYVRTLAMENGVGFIDVAGIFCDGGCRFFYDEQFSYFDQDHWTEVGAQRFFNKLRSSDEYNVLVTKSK
jgi:peptidoglycan/LPS O-acetylase OafA/YrhL